MSDDPTGAGADPRWLDAAQQRHWRSYLEGVSRFIETLGREHERHLSVSLSEYELLVRLSESETGTVRMSVLADGLAHSRSRVTHTVGRMEQRGLVARVATPGDRRGVDCVMTAKGRATLVAEAPAHVDAVRRLMVDALTDEQFAHLGEAMAVVARRCREIEAD